MKEAVDTNGLVDAHGLVRLHTMGTLSTEKALRVLRKCFDTWADEEKAKMAEDEDRAWRDWVLSDETLTMAERVEKVMRGRQQRLPGAGPGAAIVDKMKGFTKQLEDDQIAIKRYQEEERARLLREQSKG